MGIIIMRKRQEKNQRVRVRYLRPEDQESVLALLNDSQNAQRAVLQLTTNPQVRRWAIRQWIDKEVLVGVFYQQQLVGMITLFPDGQEPEVGYFIAQKWEHRHIMTLALGQFLENSPSANLVAEVAANNVASQHVLENNGFVRVNRHQGLIHYRWQMA